MWEIHKFGSVRGIKQSRKLIKMSPLQKYKQIWENCLKLDEKKTLEENFLFELQDFFHIPMDEIRYKFEKAEELFSREWAKHKLDKDSTEEKIKYFYNATELEIFELMNWHSKGLEEGPLRYVCALDIVKKLGGNKYLDFGSGVGSGTILFARNGFQVYLADISTPLLDFAKYRFKKRMLSAEFIDLKSENLPDHFFDVITVFDVLEHIKDPIGLLTELREQIHDNGIIILNTPFREDKDRPMHIVNNEKLALKFRGLGFDYLDEYSYCFDLIHKGGIILKKTSRTKLGNKLITLYDYHIPNIVKRILRLLKKRLKGC